MVVRSQVEESRRGQNYGLMIGLTGLIVSLVLAYLGHDAVGGIIGGSTLVGLVTVFVVGRTKQREELQRKGNNEVEE